MYLYRQLKRKSFRFVLKKGMPSLICFVLQPVLWEPLYFSGSLFVAILLIFSLPGLIEIGRLVYALCGGYQRRVRRYIAQSPNPDLTLDQMERAYIQADRRPERLCIAGPWTFVQDGPETHLYETAEILWVYQSEQGYPREHYGGKFLVVCDANGRWYQFPMPERMVAQALAAFAAYAPFVVCGYSSQLAALYQNNLSWFTRQVRQRQQAAQTQR